jgi:hypothetical protein
MIVSLPIGDKGVGLFVHDFMGNFPVLEVLAAFPKNAVSLIFNSSCCYKDDIVLVDCTMNNLRPQSGVDMTPVNTSDQSQEQNVGFVDGEADVISAIPHDLSYTKVDTSQNVQLGSFLSRPVQIFEQSWQIGTNLSAATSTFNPWYEYFIKASIKKKLDNYYLVRCNLHLKFVINASPFYYGCCLVAYQPLTAYNPGLILTNTARNENIPLSQRPHIYLYPQNSQGGEMVLPFLYHRNWLDATSAAALNAMGTIDLQSLTTLQNANGLTTDTINIKVYAWADDLEIAGPTAKLALQAGQDEYQHKGVVSRPASAIARAASMLSDLPVIGPFATATSYAAGAIGDIAALFGYTNVPVIDDVHGMVNKPFPNLASTDIGTPVEKLTLDAKNELSIDGKICGADVNDELTIKSFCSRESFLFKTSWASTDAAATGLFYAKPSPVMLERDATLTGAVAIYNTPMSHVARCFKYWRGDIKFKFKFICSAYHRGRVVINWDPIGTIGVTGEYNTETYTRIVDISTETELEICVPYTSTAAYLDVADEGVYFAKASTSTFGIGSSLNGTLTMRVLNEQTSPVSSADIDILVFVSGCDNLEFASPVDLSSLYSPYAPQSGVQFDVGTPETNIGLAPSVPDKNINLVYMGESCVSLRQLMRRSGKYKRTAGNENSAAEYFVSTIWLLGRSPEYPGFDTTGNETAIGINSAVSEPYNWTAWHPITWFSQCFVGSRGAYHYTLNPSDQSDVCSITCARSYSDRTTPITVTLDLPITNRIDYIRRFADSTTQSTGNVGLSLTSQRTLAGEMVSIPMYSKFKFLKNDPLVRTDGDSYDHSDTDTFAIETVTRSDVEFNPKYLSLDLYVSAGTDFSLVFFLNVPTLYLYDSLPGAT